MTVPDPPLQATSPRYPSCASPEELARNLAGVRRCITGAATACGRDPREVRLLPVSKTVGERRIRWAYDAGVRLLGENKVQEARVKSELFRDVADLGWSVIGHLQTNKARYVARFAAEFQALDSRRVAHALERRLQIEGRGLDVFVQVNSSGEASKYGLVPDDLPGFVAALRHCPGLRVRGLMTLAILSGDRARVRACFARMSDLRDRLRQDGPDPAWFDELSMGMSGDYEMAIREGATIVRVGQAIFGERPTDDSHYWPPAG